MRENDILIFKYNNTEGIVAYELRVKFYILWVLNFIQPYLGFPNRNVHQKQRY